MNGGKIPLASNFSKLASVDGFPFKEYIAKVTEVSRQGSMSLAGVVEYTYDLNVTLENPQDPGFFATSDKKKQYNQYKTLAKAVGISTANYIKWRDTPPQPVPSPTSQQEPVTPQNGTEPTFVNSGHNGQEPTFVNAGHGGNNNEGGGGHIGSGHLPNNNPNWDGGNAKGK